MDPEKLIQMAVPLLADNHQLTYAAAATTATPVLFCIQQLS